MRKMDHTQIKKDAVGELRHAYALEFPELKAEHDKLLRKQACGICIRGYLNALQKHPKLKEGLIAIYGEEVEVDFARVNKVAQLKTIKEEIPIDEWGSWYEKVHGVKDKRQIPTIVSAMYYNGKVNVFYTKSVIVEIGKDV
jgi:hypothetical protein